MSINVFVLRMSNPGFLELAQRDNIAIIGWAQLTGMNEFSTRNDLEAQKRRDRIKEVLRSSKWYDNERAIGN